MGSLGHEKVTIAVIGAGVIGSHHASLVANCPDSCLSAIVDPTEAGRLLAEEYGCEYFTDTTGLLQSPSHVDAAIVCTPNSTHEPISKLLSEYGIHLLIEKPVTTTVEEGKALLKVCRQNGIRVCIGHHRRSHPSIEAAKQSLDTGSIGQCIGVSGVWVALKPNEYFNGPGAWHREKSGDVVLINLIHEVDLLQYLLGPIQRVFAESSISSRGYAAEEGVAITLKFTCGVVGTFLALDNAASPFSIEGAIGESPLYPFTGKDCYRFFGSRGTLTVPDGRLWQPECLDKGRLSGMKQSQLQWNHQDAYQRQVRNFINVARCLEEPVCSVVDGLSAVAVCEAVRRSLSEGSPVDVEQID
ncbi:uncharacterized protein HMPREF1541_05531 [Cyphellophora europaea CBS 101466]|uniref:Gfo/Idh/MocA-like oxidoreductase N-terminal domain-containing protein n=1 Tax=Cyphellophora europaea (strain CBS 101466) TaxID=1220924 RepID=W2RU62_CYPE1|nr:uncharacterized protein HMPREF1541_05531 [Cyphellophora europaea CBS 101466]ETN39308.1 hypothetical protein HMPREF1541_05531 [Cyphellophora europaea CBS 101466]